MKLPLNDLEKSIYFGAYNAALTGIFAGRKVYHEGDYLPATSELELVNKLAQKAALNALIHYRTTIF